jgi:hypothetical protein
MLFYVCLLILHKKYSSIYLSIIYIHLTVLVQCSVKTITVSRPRIMFSSFRDFLLRRAKARHNLRSKSRHRIVLLRTRLSHRGDATTHRVLATVTATAHGPAIIRIRKYEL